MDDYRIWGRNSVCEAYYGAKVGMVKLCCTCTYVQYRTHRRVLGYSIHGTVCTVERMQLLEWSLVFQQTHYLYEETI